MPTHQWKPHSPHWRTTRSRSDYAHAPVKAHAPRWRTTLSRSGYAHAKVEAPCSTLVNKQLRAPSWPHQPQDSLSALRLVTPHNFPHGRIMRGGWTRGLCSGHAWHTPPYQVRALGLLAFPLPLGKSL